MSYITLHYVSVALKSLSQPGSLHKCHHVLLFEGVHPACKMAEELE